MRGNTPLIYATMNLLEHLPISQYGQGKAKTVEHLLKEIESGETQIIWENEKPIRVINLVCVEVISEDGEQQLVEEKQVFSDGRVRERGIWGVSEKLKPNEDPYQGAVRAMKEELGVENCSIQFDSTDTEESESPSYPGLTTRYLKTNYQARVWNEDYKLEGYVEAQADKTTYFAWR